jgi:hypothetical protein
MPYKLIRTNGTTLATVQDASVDNTTSLTFVGRNYSGYGQPVEENFVKLLENFANTTVPAKPIQGQLWFNNTPTVRRLYVCYDGTHFRDVSNVQYSPSAPTNSSTGDLWWDSVNNQIKVYNAITNTWTASQPYGGASSSWDFSRIEDSNTNDQSAIKGLIGTTPVVIFSNFKYSPNSLTGLDIKFPVINRGINLPGADPVTGSSTNSTSTGYMLWGTAADALSTQKIGLSSTTDNSVHYIPFAISTDGVQSLYTTSTFSFNPSTNILNVTAASALYADLAERYEADSEYDFGTVLMIGGGKEVTIATGYATTAVAGIVSKNPAYMMNSEAGSDKTHPYIALKGRVPCKVFGTVNKGDILVVSEHPGHAQAADLNRDVHPAAIIGKALEANSEGFGIIEVKV